MRLRRIERFKKGEKLIGNMKNLKGTSYKVGGMFLIIVSIISFIMTATMKEGIIFQGITPEVRLFGYVFSLILLIIGVVLVLKF